MRVIEPTTLDAAGLADGIRRNNVGVAAITVQVRARLERDGDAVVAVLEPGGQRVPLAGDVTPDGPDDPARRRTFSVRGWDAAETVRWELRPGPPTL